MIGQPLSTATVYALRGRTITVGGWLWADQPGIGRLELVIGDETGASRLVALPSTLATTPTFTQHRVTIPTTAASISYAWPNVITPTTGLASRLWLQQPLLVTGSFSSATSPRWADAAYQQGTWDGQPFRNLLHNAGLEQTWPRPQPWLTERVVMYSRFNLATMLPALLDTQRTQPLLRMAGEQVLFSYFGAFAWGHIRLASAWQWLWLALGLGAAGGAIRWMWEHRRSHTNFGSLALLAALGAAVWSLAVLRILPALEARPFVPSARYVLPVLFPTTLFLVGGWWTPWPRRWRWLGLAVSLGMFGALEIAAVYQVWAYYHGGQ